MTVLILEWVLPTKFSTKPLKPCYLKKEITWHSASQQQLVMERFQNSRENPFPYVVGCVDGTHLKILKPKEDAISYYNRKGFYSVNMQVSAIFIIL